MSLFTDLLSTGGYVLYNKAVARKTSMEAAILLGTLCFYAGRHDGEFFCQQDRLIEDTVMTEYALKAAMQQLTKLGVVMVEKKGMPAKNYYSINEDRLEEVMGWDLSSGCEITPTSQVTAPVGAKTSPLVGAISGPQTNKSINNNISKREEYTESNEEDTKDTTKTRVRARFTIPTVEEVRAYCLERKNYVNAQQFVDFYSAKGWVVGRAPMKDWKAAVRTWEQHDNDRPNPVPREKPVVYDY